MWKGNRLVALHVCSISPAAGQTGYEIRVVEEVRLLRQQGVKVIILSFFRQDQLLPIKRLLTFYRRLRRTSGARVYIVPTSHFFDLHLPPGGNPGITRAIVFFARLHRAQVVHGQALYSVMHILRARPKLNARVVFDVHGVSPEETEMSGGQPGRVQKLAEWEADALRSADAFIFVSSKMSGYFKKKYSLDVCNYSLVPCCVHTERFAMPWDERERKRREMGLADRFIVCYLGTLTAWQWPDAMFSLAAQIRQRKPETFLYLLIPESDHEKARSFLAQHNIPAGAYRLEEIPHERVGSLLGIADAGLLLRKAHPVNEVASPTKFGEYLAAGVPVIITDKIGDTSEIVARENIGVIISPADSGVNEHDLKNVLSFAESLQSNRKEIADRCTNVAKGNLEWSNYAEILFDSYLKVIRSNKLPR